MANGRPSAEWLADNGCQLITIELLAALEAERDALAVKCAVLAEALKRVDTILHTRNSSDAVNIMGASVMIEKALSTTPERAGSSQAELTPEDKEAPMGTPQFGVPADGASRSSAGRALPPFSE